MLSKRDVENEGIQKNVVDGFDKIPNMSLYIGLLFQTVVNRITFISAHWSLQRLTIYNSGTVLHAAGMEQQSLERRLNEIVHKQVGNKNFKAIMATEGHSLTTSTSCYPATFYCVPATFHCDFVLFFTGHI